MWPSTFDRASAIVELRTRTRTAIFELDPTAGQIVVPGEVARVVLEESTAATGFWVNTRALIRSTHGLWALYVAEPECIAEPKTLSGNESDPLEASRLRRVSVLAGEDQVLIQMGSKNPVDAQLARGGAKVSRRDVEVLHTDAERSFVRGLIEPGDWIIVSGTQRVVPGQAVRAVPTTQSPNAETPTR
jgi:hypothetical protein